MEGRKVPRTCSQRWSASPRRGNLPPLTDRAACRRDGCCRSGNITPTITKLTIKQEAAILKDVKVADEFEVTLFANSAAANHPVFVAASTEGTLYVSSDGNGSLGLKPNRGRVIRLRDVDDDGRADDHGYPRLYMNFNDECVQPLADYGGGSGCGAVYIDEPGFGAWNNAPFTCDWGTGALWHHQDAEEHAELNQGIRRRRGRLLQRTQA